MAGTPFDIEVSIQDADVTVRLQGELDFTSADILDSATCEVADRDAVHLVLDFENLTFLDSEGVKVLIQIWRKVKKANGTLEIVSCRPDVGRVFEILGFSEQLCVRVAGVSN